MDPETRKVTVEIPVSYLVQIATHGKMGTGELGAFIQAWAKRKCRENNLQDEVVKALGRKIRQSRRNLENILGKDIMDELDDHIDKGLEKAQKLWRRGDEGNAGHRE